MNLEESKSTDWNKRVIFGFRHIGWLIRACQCHAYNQAIFVKDRPALLPAIIGASINTRLIPDCVRKPDTLPVTNVPESPYLKFGKQPPLLGLVFLCYLTERSIRDLTASRPIEITAKSITSLRSHDHYGFSIRDRTRLKSHGIVG